MNVSGQYQNTSASSCDNRNLPSLKRNKLLKRIQRTHKKFQEKPLPPAFKTRLDGPSITWRVFSRLQMATSYTDSSTKDCMIFSFEEKTCNAGQRLFLVAHPKKFWANHRSRRPEDRCSYEVIRENYPCKLFFDLEFYTCFNPEKKGVQMTEIFIKCVKALMYEQHNLTLKDSDFLWLDASNDGKFSCHLILQSRNACFQNNIHAGTFVSLLTSTLRKRISENMPPDAAWPSAQDIESLLVKSKKENEVFFCDEAVYSKNRNFRLYLSTKLGKRSPLMLSPHNKYVPPLVDPNHREEAIFYDSLITYFRSGRTTQLLSYDEKIQSNILNNSFCRTGKVHSGTCGYGSSLFPDLDNFILEKVRDELAVGFIRKWTYLNHELKMVYDIGNYRYCGNIGRHHKSNNIKIIVDMKAKFCFQTCLDPECRQVKYRSEAFAVPDSVLFLSVPDDFFDGDCFSQLQSSEQNDENKDPNAMGCQSAISEVCHVDEESAFQLEECFWDVSDDENVDGNFSGTNKERLDQDFSACFNEDTWDKECGMTKTTDSSSDISLDEAIQLAKAAEAIEAMINNNASV